MEYSTNMISHSWYCLLALQLHILGVADSTIYASIVHLYSQLSYINARTLLELARADLDSDLSGRAAAPTQAMHARRRTRWQTVKLQVARPGQVRAADRDLHA